MDRAREQSIAGHSRFFWDWWRVSERWSYSKDTYWRVAYFSRGLCARDSAAANAINGWLADNNLSKGKRVAYYLGQNKSKAEFTARGAQLAAGAQPYRFYLLQRVQGHFGTLNFEERVAVKSLLKRCDLVEVLDITLVRRLGHKGNLKIWL